MEPHSQSSTDLPRFNLNMFEKPFTFLNLPFVCFLGYRVLAIELFSKNINPVVEEFRQAELSCIIAATKTANPRIEWKKIGSQGTTYVYYDGKVQGEWVNRVQLISRTSLTIYNVTRADKGIYRCEVVAPDDAILGAEINVNLTVHVKPVAPKCRVPPSVPVGKSATLYCQEKEGFPEPTYSWYRNDETLPLDSKASTKFQNSSFTVNPKTGMLAFEEVHKGDSGRYSCRATNVVGEAWCEGIEMEVYAQLENLLYETLKREAGGNRVTEDVNYIGPSWLHPGQCQYVASNKSFEVF
uniref:Junctional adhesion molecule 3 n=1 Tax=Pseudonaja textilis TaxID=8673 RepID=A0A670YRZ3_PSETE